MNISIGMMVIHPKVLKIWSRPRNEKKWWVGWNQIGLWPAEKKQELINLPTLESNKDSKISKAPAFDHLNLPPTAWIEHGNGFQLWKSVDHSVAGHQLKVKGDLGSKPSELGGYPLVI